MSRLRNWCFTLFVEEEKDYNELIRAGENGIRLGVWQLECCPETSRLHIQGYIEFECSYRMAAVKRILGNDSVHLEGRKGTRAEAIAYCKKVDSRVRGPWISGSDADLEPGKRTDLHNVAEAILSGQELGTLVHEYPTMYIKYSRGIQNLHFIGARERSKVFRSVEVLVYYGDAGTGKTRKSVEENPVHYILDQGERLWFDGYYGEPTLIIDDFYGWIKYGQLLRILDGYQYRCEIKGGFTYAMWTKVVVTSNKHPREWYSQGLTPALARRISSIVHFDNIAHGGE